MAADGDCFCVCFPNDPGARIHRSDVPCVTFHIGPAACRFLSPFPNVPCASMYNAPVCGEVAQLVGHQTDMLLTQVRFPGAARDFYPGVNFQRRLSYGVRTPPCAISCINIFVCNLMH